MVAVRTKSKTPKTENDQDKKFEKKRGTEETSEPIKKKKKSVDKTESSEITSDVTPAPVGPDTEKINALLKRTGYSLTVTPAQRKYGGPPPNWDGPESGPTSDGYKIKIDHIPASVYEDTLVPLFELAGPIWDLCMKLDTSTSAHKGYAFITYCEKSAATDAMEQWNGHHILPGKPLSISLAEVRTRLFLARIPKTASKTDIEEELKKLSVEGVVDVVITTYKDKPLEDGHFNPGFCFVDFADQQKAAFAKWKFETKFKPFKKDVVVDWGTKKETIDMEEIKKAKIMLVKNLTDTLSEGQLRQVFESFGEIESIKKVKDHAYVHFVESKACQKAIKKWNGKDLEGSTIACQASITKAADQVALSKVKDMLVKNLSKTVTQEKLNEIFGVFGKIAKVVKKADHAYINFKLRTSCLKAIEEWNDKELEGSTISCLLVTPKSKTAGQAHRERELAKKAKKLNKTVSKDVPKDRAPKNTFRDHKKPQRPQFESFQSGRGGGSGGRFNPNMEPVGVRGSFNAGRGGFDLKSKRGNDASEGPKHKKFAE